MKWNILKFRVRSTFPLQLLYVFYANAEKTGGLALLEFIAWKQARMLSVEFLYERLLILKVKRRNQNDFPFNLFETRLLMII